MPREFVAFSRSEPVAHTPQSGRRHQVGKTSCSHVQSKLRVSSPQDGAEREADRVAERVLDTTPLQADHGLLHSVQARMVQRCPGGCQNAELQRKMADGGEPLDPWTRTYFQQRFWRDFGDVRLHTGREAAGAATAIGARAFTYGSSIAFAPGEYAPHTTAGRRLLAHELTHVVQQTNEAHRTGAPRHTPSRTIQRQVGRPHDLTATRFARNQSLEAVFDGHSLLRRGSVGTAVRLVQESLLAQGYPLPLHGADGDFGQETETAVREFQVDAGAGVDGVIGDETMQLLDMHDPGGTAVIGPVPIFGPQPPPPPAPPPPATAATFSEWAGEQFSGYDDSTAPDWLVVPTGGRRRSQVALIPPAAVPVYVSADPTVATVDPTPEGAVVTGVADGATEVRVQEGAAVLDRLRVEVKDRLDQTVDFHFMSDTVPAPGPNHATTRVPAAATDMTSSLNEVWERQANVRFRTGTVDSPQVTTDLGDQVLWAAGPANEWATIVAFATGGDYNVFLVWEYEQDATPLVSHVNAGTAAGNTLLEDNECGDGLTLAHEAGHFLNATHAMGRIMSGCAGANRRRVTKLIADAVNP